MKIRTGFVTNSSSYSSAEIIIDNPVLIDILKKHKDCCRRPDDPRLRSRGEIVTAESNGEKHTFWRDRLNDGGHFTYIPETLDGIMDAILEVISAKTEKGIIPAEPSDKLIDELKERSDEIKSAFRYAEAIDISEGYDEFALTMEDFIGEEKWNDENWDNASYYKIVRGIELEDGEIRRVVHIYRMKDF